MSLALLPESIRHYEPSQSRKENWKNFIENGRISRYFSHPKKSFRKVWSLVVVILTFLALFIISLKIADYNQKSSKNSPYEKDYTTTYRKADQLSYPTIQICSKNKNSQMVKNYVQTQFLNFFKNVTDPNDDELKKFLTSKFQMYSNLDRLQRSDQIQKRDSMKNQDLLGMDACINNLRNKNVNAFNSNFDTKIQAFHQKVKLTLIKEMEIAYPVIYHYRKNLRSELNLNSAVQNQNFENLPILDKNFDQNNIESKRKFQKLAAKYRLKIKMSRFTWLNNGNINDLLQTGCTSFRLHLCFLQNSNYDIQLMQLFDVEGMRRAFSRNYRECFDLSRIIFCLKEKSHVSSGKTSKKLLRQRLKKDRSIEWQICREFMDIDNSDNSQQSDENQIETQQKSSRRLANLSTGRIEQNIYHTEISGTLKISGTTSSNLNFVSENKNSVNMGLFQDLLYTILQNNGLHNFPVFQNLFENFCPESFFDHLLDENDKFKKIKKCSTEEFAGYKDLENTKNSLMENLEKLSEKNLQVVYGKNFQVTGLRVIELERMVEDIKLIVDRSGHQLKDFGLNSQQNLKFLSISGRKIDDFFKDDSVSVQKTNHSNQCLELKFDANKLSQKIDDTDGLNLQITIPKDINITTNEQVPSHNFFDSNVFSEDFDIRPASFPDVRRRTFGGVDDTSLSIIVKSEKLESSYDQKINLVPNHSNILTLNQIEFSDGIVESKIAIWRKKLWRAIASFLSRVFDVLVRLIYGTWDRKNSRKIENSNEFDSVADSPPISLPKFYQVKTLQSKAINFDQLNSKNYCDNLLRNSNLPLKAPSLYENLALIKQCQNIMENFFESDNNFKNLALLDSLIYRLLDHDQFDEKINLKKVKQSFFTNESVFYQHFDLYQIRLGLDYNVETKIESGATASNYFLVLLLDIFTIFIIIFGVSLFDILGVFIFMAFLIKKTLGRYRIKCNWLCKIPCLNKDQKRNEFLELDDINKNIVGSLDIERDCIDRELLKLDTAQAVLQSMANQKQGDGGKDILRSGSMRSTHGRNQLSKTSSNMHLSDFQDRIMLPPKPIVSENSNSNHRIIHTMKPPIGPSLRKIAVSADQFILDQTLMNMRNIQDFRSKVRTSELPNQRRNHTVRLRPKNNSDSSIFSTLNNGNKKHESRREAFF